MSSYSVSIADAQRLVPIDRRRLVRLARSILEREGVARAEISVAVVDDRQIHAVNRDFLKHDFPTDVISFLFDGQDAMGKRPAARRRGSGHARRRAKSAVPRGRRGTGKKLDGEIVISAETALRVARELNADPADELALYLVHGLLHLCGYDDLTPKEKRLMRRREADALWESRRET